MRKLSILALLAFVSHAWANWPQFEEWYPQLRYQLQYFVQHNCSSQHHDYIHGRCPAYLPPSQPPSLHDTACKTAAAAYLTECILKHMADVDKSWMAGATILLGLLPTVLSLAASSTVETGVLALRRPGLALLLAAGSPSVSPLRTFDYRDYTELLQIRPQSRIDANHTHSDRRNTRLLILVLQYVLAAAAAANVILTSWTLSNRTIYAAGSQAWGYPILWTLLTIPVHFLGAVAVQLRVNLRSPDFEDRAHVGGPRSLLARVRNHVREEFRVSASQRHLVMSLRGESNAFLLFSSGTSTSVIVHIIWGTVVLGSTLFIGPGDATGVVGQYLVSTLVCRAIVSYEMRGIRKTLVTEEDNISTPALARSQPLHLSVTTK